MPLHTSMVGSRTTPITHDVDDRWLMAYAAGLHDLNPRYLDTQAHIVCAHPVFPVCLEWPAILACRDGVGFESVSDEERARGVHAAHDLHLMRPIRPGDRLSTQLTVIGLNAIRPGAAQLMRIDTRDASGELVCRTYQTGISRAVSVLGDAVAGEPAPAWPQPPGPASDTPLARHRIEVPAGAAHVYTECARIWNPIHTDRRVALGAGLPDIILHGTATMALAVSCLVDHYLGGDPTRVRRLGGRFSAMVLMPDTLTVAVHAQSAGCLFFTVFNQRGEAAFSHAFLCHDDAR